MARDARCRLLAEDEMCCRAATAPARCWPASRPRPNDRFGANSYGVSSACQKCASKYDGVSTSRLNTGISRGRTVTTCGVGTWPRISIACAPRTGFAPCAAPCS